jgi:hypothetical protein
MPAALEVLAVLLSPLVLYAVLRVRGMAPPQLPDPTLHTTYIIDPHAIFDRYQVLFDPSARLREAARVGFLAPARVSYLLFGAVTGFFVFRYALALIAIVPVYVLLRRLYGRWAGFLGIAVIMTSPVVLTAWGTDFPDSAAVSYLTGGLAALALWWSGRRWRYGWLVTAAALMTMAVWSIGAALPLVIALIAAYVGVRLAREREGLARDLALLVGTAVLVTAGLAVCSKLLIGQFNFISPTVRSARYLSQPWWVRNDHSSSWAWAPWDPWLLVPPAVVLAFIAAFGRRWRQIATSVLFVGAAGALELAVFAFAQFLWNFQALEVHYFSSTLWSSTNVLLAVALAELARPLAGAGPARPLAGAGPARPLSGARPARPLSGAGPGGRPGWLGAARALRWAAPAALVLAVTLVYELLDKIGHPVPGMRWTPGGLILAAVLVAGAVLGRAAVARASGWSAPSGWLAAMRLLAPAAAMIVVTGAALVLTVAQQEQHPLPANTVFYPPPPYASALGGNDSIWRSEYTASTELPGFVGRPAYKGELLLTWEPPRQFGALQEPIGIYHNAITFVTETFPVLTQAGVQKIESWRAAQVLLMSLTGDSFDQAVRALRPFDPVVVRRAVLGNGSYRLHVWLVDLRRYLRGSAA